MDRIVNKIYEIKKVIERKSFLLVLISCLFLPLRAQEITRVYKRVDQITLSLYIKYPNKFDAKKKYPAIIFFFGGGWVGGSVEQFFPQASLLADKEIISICAEYRVQKKHGVTPFVCLEDAKSAIRYLRKYAEELSIQENQIVASGGSAGGHLAAATACIERYNSLEDNVAISCISNALILFNPVLDNGPNGYGYERIGEEFLHFSPFYNVRKGLPPTIIFLGTNDNLISEEVMKEYREKMIEKGNRCELVLYDGQTHGFFNNKNGNDFFFYATFYEMINFLCSLGLITR